MSVNPQPVERDVPMPSPAPVPNRPSTPQGTPFRSLDDVGEALMSQRYVADSSLAMSIFLACGLPRPLLVEGEAGVGKTEIAKVLSTALGTRLIRLQCYEGIDVRQAVYEWNYSKQMLRIRSLEQHETLGEAAFPPRPGPPRGGDRLRDRKPHGGARHAVLRRRSVHRRALSRRGVWRL